MEFQLSYSKSWKMMLWKCSTQYVSKFGKLCKGHSTGKGPFSFQSQRKAMPKNAQIPHNCTHFTLAKWCSKFSMPGFNSTWIVNFQIFKKRHGFRKGRGTKDQITNIHWIIKKAREFQKNIYFCFIDYAKAFVWLTINCGKFWKRWEYQTTWPASWEICRSGSNS